MIVMDAKIIKTEVHHLIYQEIRKPTRQTILIRLALPLLIPVMIMLGLGAGTSSSVLSAGEIPAYVYVFFILLFLFIEIGWAFLLLKSQLAIKINDEGIFFKVKKGAPELLIPVSRIKVITVRRHAPLFYQFPPIATINFLNGRIYGIRGKQFIMLSDDPQKPTKVIFPTQNIDDCLEAIKKIAPDATVIERQN